MSMQRAVARYFIFLDRQIVTITCRTRQGSGFIGQAMALIPCTSIYSSLWQRAQHVLEQKRR